MKKFWSILILAFCTPAMAQIADSSFFPSVRSLNPGVAYLRTQSLISLDVSKKQVKKNHAVTTGGIVGGIQTDVDLQKNSLFMVGKFGWLTAEALVDKETGEKVEHINSTTRGKRDVMNDSESVYAGAILGVKFFGVSFATASYNTDYKFRVGTPPDVSAKDIATEINYTLAKVGTAFNIGGFTFGLFGMEKRSKERYAYTYYDPTTGLQGTTEIWPASSSAAGIGVGLGFTAKSFRIEFTGEQMEEADVEYKENPLDVIKTAPGSSRVGAAVEMRIWKLSLGARVRNNAGNFTDLEDLISSNLLYGEMSEDDTRLETSFNFGFGSDKGLSVSAFYTFSETKTSEVSTIFNDAEKFPASTKANAYGANISYYF